MGLRRLGKMAMATLATTGSTRTTPNPSPSTTATAMAMTTTSKSSSAERRGLIGQRTSISVAMATRRTTRSQTRNRHSLLLSSTLNEKDSNTNESDNVCDNSLNTITVEKKKKKSVSTNRRTSVKNKRKVVSATVADNDSDDETKDSNTMDSSPRTPAKRPRARRGSTDESIMPPVAVTPDVITAASSFSLPTTTTVNTKAKRVLKSKFKTQRKPKKKSTVVPAVSPIKVDQKQSQNEEEKQEVVVKVQTKETSTLTRQTASPKKKSPTTKKKSHERAAPSDWQTIYSLVEELRTDRTAPVDTNGSEALPQREFGLETFRFQVLIALMLSSQTKDAVVGDAMRKLQSHGLTLDKIAETDFDTLNGLIGKVGFHNTKAKNILKVVEILQSKYNGDIPPTATEMIRDLPGVGPKMAYIVENVAWNRSTGIGVDTHMHRMFNQLKWVDSKQPEHTRLQLESWLPKEYWPTVNVLWVGFGQEVQQFQDKLLRKALNCSRPQEALKLVKKLGLDYKKVGAKMEIMEEIQLILKKEHTKEL